MKIIYITVFLTATASADFDFTTLQNPLLPLPKFEIKLDEKPEERWLEVALHYKEFAVGWSEQITEIMDFLTGELNEELVKYGVPFQLEKTTMQKVYHTASLALQLLLPMEYALEIRPFYENTTLTQSEALLMAFNYEFFGFACATVITKDADGNPWIGRNLDMPSLNGLILKSSFIATFTKDGEIQYEGVTWAFNPGLYTAQKPNFAIGAINSHEADHVAEILERVSHGLFWAIEQRSSIIANAANLYTEVIEPHQPITDADKQGKIWAALLASAPRYLWNDNDGALGFNDVNGANVAEHAMLSPGIALRHLFGGAYPFDSAIVDAAKNIKWLSPTHLSLITKTTGHIISTEIGKTEPHDWALPTPSASNPMPFIFNVNNDYDNLDSTDPRMVAVKQLVPEIGSSANVSAATIASVMQNPRVGQKWVVCEIQYLRTGQCDYGGGTQMSFAARVGDSTLFSQPKVFLNGFPEPKTPATTQTPSTTVQSTSAQTTAATTPKSTTVLITPVTTIAVQTTVSTEATTTIATVADNIEAFDYRTVSALLENSPLLNYSRQCAADFFYSWATLYGSLTDRSAVLLLSHVGTPEFVNEIQTAADTMNDFFNCKVQFVNNATHIADGLLQGMTEISNANKASTTVSPVTI